MSKHSSHGGPIDGKQKRTDALADRFRRRHKSMPRGAVGDAFAFIESLHQVSDKRHAGKIKLI